MSCRQADDALKSAAFHALPTAQTTIDIRLHLAVDRPEGGVQALSGAPFFTDAAGFYGLEEQASGCWGAGGIMQPFQLFMHGHQTREDEHAVGRAAHAARGPLLGWTDGGHTT